MDLFDWSEPKVWIPGLLLVIFMIVIWSLSFKFAFTPLPFCIAGFLFAISILLYIFKQRR